MFVLYFKKYYTQWQYSMFCTEILNWTGAGLALAIFISKSWALQRCTKLHSHIFLRSFLPLVWNFRIHLSKYYLYWKKHESLNCLRVEPSCNHRGNYSYDTLVFYEAFFNFCLYECFYKSDGIVLYFNLKWTSFARYASNSLVKYSHIIICIIIYLSATKK